MNNQEDLRVIIQKLDIIDNKIDNIFSTNTDKIFSNIFDFCIIAFFVGSIFIIFIKMI